MIYIYIVLRPASYSEDHLDEVVGAYVDEEVAKLVSSSDPSSRIVTTLLENRSLKR